MAKQGEKEAMAKQGEKEAMAKRSSLILKLKRFCQLTSMHGCGYILESNHTWSRLVWVILTLGGVAGLTVHLYFLTAQYTSWQKTTSTTLGFSNQKFPAITLCNVNIMRNSQLGRLEEHDALKKVVNFFNPNNLLASNSSATGGGSNTDDTQVRKKRFVASMNEANMTEFMDRDMSDMTMANNGLATDMSTEFKMESILKYQYMKTDRNTRANLGHNISNMLLDCTFGGRMCFSDNFTLHQTDDYGNCWTFNSSQLMAKLPGPSGGLSLTLYLEAPEFLEGITTGMGLVLVVHEPGTEPYPGDEGILISAAQETNIGLLKTTISRLNGRYGECTDGLDFKEKYGIHYTRSACERACRLEEELARCSCYGASSENLAIFLNRSSHFCSSAAERNCNMEVDMDYQEKLFQCTCSNPCEESQYYTSMSSRQWPNTNYASMLIQGLCEQHPSVCSYIRGKKSDHTSLSSNFLKLNIYFQSLNYEHIEETPVMEFPTFISSVGGSLGLWIGLSVLSLCEIIQLLGEFIWAMRGNCHR